MEEKDRKILLERPYSDHPDDIHLLVVLALYKNKEYVTWTHNKGRNTFDTGHYFGNNQEAAVEDYLRRGKSNYKLDVNKAIRDKISEYIQNDLECPELEAEEICSSIFEILLDINK